MKKIQKKALITGFLVAALGISGCGSPGQKGAAENEIVRINGIAVFEEEFEMLLEQNYLQYERELSEEFAIPSDTQVRQFFEGEEEYRTKLADKNIEKLCKIKVQQKAAQDRGLSEGFSWEVFQKQLKDENSLREEKVRNGEVIYGLTSFREEEFYTYQMDAMVHVLKDDFFKEEAVNITTQEIQDYYEKLDFPLCSEGERYGYLLCDVTKLTEREGKDVQKTLEVLTQKLTEGSRQQDEEYLEENGLKYALETRILNSEELRKLIRSALNAEVLLTLSKGQVSQVLDLEGKDWLVRYEGIQKVEMLSETDQTAVKSMILEDKYEAFVNQQTEEAVIEVQEEALKNNFIKGKGEL